LARFGLRKAKLPVPLPFSIDNVQIKNMPGTQIQLTAGIFRAVLRPRIDASGAVDLTAQFVGVSLPGIVTDRIKQQINKEVADLRAACASLGLQLQLTGVDSELGVLLISAVVGA